MVLLQSGNSKLFFFNKKNVGKFSKDWMDLWDLGILIANRAYQAGRPWESTEIHGWYRACDGWDGTVS